MTAEEWIESTDRRQSLDAGDAVLARPIIIELYRLRNEQIAKADYWRNKYMEVSGCQSVMPPTMLAE
jgi:hypothetical protein